MPFYTCNRYKLVISILIVLIIWQSIRLWPKNVETKDTEPILLEMEDDLYNKHRNDKVKVRVYYEALCPDSKHFFIRHLEPTTEKLYEFLDVTLVPYGKATTTEENGQYSFKCQHGEEECYANKIHACSIDYLANMTVSVKFTACMIANNRNALEALRQCGKKMQIPVDEIITCADSTKGSNLLKKHGDDTHSVVPTFIPTIVIVNNSEVNQPALLKNFLLEMCKLIDMPLPPPCL